MPDKTVRMVGWVVLLAMGSGASSRSMVPSPTPAPARQEPAGAVTVQIVPTYVQMERRVLWRHDFNVVVTNGTHKTIRLWTRWCSWGYESLSFEARAKDGTLSRITIKPIPWTKNGPFWTSVPPGEHLVINVKFDDLAWAATPGPLPNRLQTVKLQAIYEIPPDDETKKYGVWTGKVSSNERAYALE